MKNSSSIVVIFLVLIFLISASLSIHASVVVKMTFDKIVSDADIILSGRVTQVQAKREQNPHTGKNSVYTYISIESEQVFRGSFKGTSYTFKILGGAIPGEPTGEMLTGAPEFKPGQEVFLFLKNDNTLYCPVVGLSQGRFNLRTDPKTGYRMVYDNYNNPITGSFISDTAGGSKDAITYEQFKAMVESRLKQTGK